MSTTPGPSVPAFEHLIRWIECSGESDNIDAKGPMKWDGQSRSAALAKDIAAFCNSPDGGVIVVGKSETAPGKFDNTGLTPEEADSFDTTRVANWINSRFSPSIHLVCYRQEHLGKTFIIITVQEFDDIPAFCVKSFQDPKDSRNHILREGTIYVRNRNAESKPVGTVDEWRALIGLATKKRGDEFLSMFNAMLKGKPLLEQPSDEEQFVREISQVWDDLGLNQPEKKVKGALWMSFSPGTYNPQRWPEPESLEELIRKHSIRVYDHFPAYQRGTAVMGWGIANDFYGETWALTRAGLFAFHKEFRENTEVCPDPFYRGGQDARTPLPPGEWIAFQWSMLDFCGFFMFMARLAGAYEPGETVRYELVATSIQGRKLASVSPDVTVGFGIPEPCRAKEYRFGAALAAEELRATWEDHCAQAMKRFYQLFPDHQISFETLRKWVERFKERRF
jgi:Schlafen, AlbA_2